PGKADQRNTRVRHERGIPARVGDHERPEGEERWQHLEQLRVSRRGEVRVEKPPEEGEERLGDSRRIAEGVVTQPEEEVVHAERRDVGGGLAPHAAAPVEHGEVHALAEEDAPGMEVAAGPRDTMTAPDAPTW